MRKIRVVSKRKNCIVNNTVSPTRRQEFEELGI